MYRIEFNGPSPAVTFASLTECEIEISRLYPDAVYLYGEISESYPFQIELDQAGRILVWENEADSEDDGGQKAVAKIVQVD